MNKLTEKEKVALRLGLWFLLMMVCTLCIAFWHTVFANLLIIPNFVFGFLVGKNLRILDNMIKKKT